MKKLRRSISTILVFVMLLSLAPLQVFADAIEEKEYSISNGYLTYTINNKTGGFSIVTADGHPQKKYDDNIPLLYKEDRNRSNGTSFTQCALMGKTTFSGRTTLFGPVLHAARTCGFGRRKAPYGTMGY